MTCSSSANQLPGDVLVELDGHAIANDGSFAIGGQERLLEPTTRLLEPTTRLLQPTTTATRAGTHRRWQPAVQAKHAEVR